MAVAPVFAVPIHDNGSPNGVTGYISDLTEPVQSQLIAENFTTGAAATARSVTFYGGYGLNSPATDIFNLIIWSDAAGEPGSIVYGQTITATRTLIGTTGTSFGGTVDLYQYSADLADLALTGSTAYWISIFNTGTTTGNRWVWASTALNDGGQFALTLGDWNPINTEFAFQLDDASTVPEPGTMLLCGAGLAAVLIRRRKA